MPLRIGPTELIASHANPPDISIKQTNQSLRDSWSSLAQALSSCYWPKAVRQGAHHLAENESISLVKTSELICLERIIHQPRRNPQPRRPRPECPHYLRTRKQLASNHDA